MNEIWEKLVIQMTFIAQNLIFYPIRMEKTLFIDDFNSFGIREIFFLLSALIEQKKSDVNKEMNRKLRENK